MENRKDKRFEEHNNVLIKQRNQASEIAAGGVINAYTHDLSLSGAWICSPLHFPVGQVIRIVIDLGGAAQPLEVRGQVIWVRENENGQGSDFGVQFLHDIPHTILALIQHFYGKKVGVPSSVS